MGRQRWRTTCGGVPRTNFNFLRVRESLSSRGAVLTTCLEGGERWRSGGNADETEKFRRAAAYIQTRSTGCLISFEAIRLWDNDIVSIVQNDILVFL